MTTQKNGTTIPTNGKKVETTVPVIPIKKDEPKKEEAKPPAEQSPLEDRLLKISQLFDLQSKYTRLNKSLQKLDDFQLKKGEDNISISIDDEGNNKLDEWITRNPDVVADTLAFIRSRIIERKKQIEALLVI